MESLVHLRVTTAFANYKVGQVIERTATEAKRMLGLSWYGHKLVEEVPPLPEAVQAEPLPLPPPTASPPAWSFPDSEPLERERKRKRAT